MLIKNLKTRSLFSFITVLALALGAAACDSSELGSDDLGEAPAVTEDNDAVAASSDPLTDSLTPVASGEEETGDGEAAGSGNDKSELLDITIEPLLISPGVVDDRNDIQTVSFMAELRASDELAAQGGGETEQFVFEWVAQYKEPDTGTVVREITDSVEVEAGGSASEPVLLPVQFEFDGRDNEGELLPDGIYILELYGAYRKGAGEKSGSITNPEKILDTWEFMTEIRIDNTPPVLTIIEPVEDQIFVEHGISLIATYEEVDGTGLDLATLSLTLNGDDITPPLDERGATQTGVVLSDTLVDSVYVAEASILDSAGNQAADTVQFVISVDSPLPPELVTDSTVTAMPDQISPQTLSLPVVMATSDASDVDALEFTFTVKDENGAVRDVYQTGSTTLLDTYTLGLPPQKAELYETPAGPAIVLPGGSVPPNAELVGSIFYSESLPVITLADGDTVEVEAVAIDQDGDKSVIPSQTKTFTVMSLAQNSGQEPLELIDSWEVVVSNGQIVNQNLPIAPNDDRINIFDRYHYIPNFDDDFTYSLSDENGFFTGEGYNGDDGSEFKAHINILQKNSPSIMIRRETVRVENEPGDNIVYRILEIPFGMDGITLIEPLHIANNGDDDFEYKVFVREVKPGAELSEEEIQIAAELTGVDPVVLANLNASFVIAEVHNGNVGSYADIRMTQLLWPKTLAPEYAYLHLEMVGSGSFGIHIVDLPPILTKPLGSNEAALTLLTRLSYIPTAPEGAQLSFWDVLIGCGGVIADAFINEEDYINVSIKGCDIQDVFTALFVDPNDDDFEATADWFVNGDNPDFIDVQTIIKWGNDYSKQQNALFFMQFPIKVP